MTLVVANEEVQDAMESRQAVLDASSTLRLYKNDYTPVVGMVIGSFSEADYSGYSSVDLTGDWSAVAQDVNDKWYTETSAHLFEHDGGGTDNDIYGWYITDGTKVFMAERYDSPITMEPGSLPFTQQIHYTGVSESELP